MDKTVLDWLLEESNPEVRLRTLKELEHYSDNDERVIACKKELLGSKVYERGLKKLKKDKPWDKYDAIMAFAEWGLTRDDIDADIDSEVFALIESTGFKMLCGEPLLLRNLVKLGYYTEDVVKNEVDSVLKLIKEDGGFGCISTNKKINDPKKPHKSCARLTVEYLLLVAELHLQGYASACEDALVHYFTKRNIFYRTDDMKTPMVDVMLGTFYPPDPIKIGAHQIVYALRVLGCEPESEAMQAGYKVLDQHRLENGRYVLTASKSVPAFKAGNVGEENKWVTLYAYMASAPESGKQKIYERFPGVSCAYRNAAGRETLKFNGVADKEKGIPVDGITVFPACSISKFVTGITVMRLSEEGLFSIDEPVNRYLSRWKLLTPEGKESEATVRSILSHTSGIIDGEDSFYGLRRSDPEVGLLDVLEGRTAYNKRKAMSEKQPGSEFEYSDAGYCVLQLMIGEVTHSDFEEVVAKYVFETLGLKQTFFASLKNLELREKNQNMAAGYDSEGSLLPGKYPQIPDLAASGLWSTPRELMMIAKDFIEAVNGRSSLLRAESAKEMIRPAENFSWVGLGLFRRGDDILVSQGWGENGQCMLKMNCKTGEVSVVMTNQDPGEDQVGSGVERLAEFN